MSERNNEFFKGSDKTNELIIIYNDLKCESMKLMLNPGYTTFFMRLSCIKVEHNMFYLN